MMRNVTSLRGYAVRATDGVIGKVDDFYFDDEDWGIRYLVVDTGKWLSGRKVLISPIAIGAPDWMIQELPVSLTKAQVKRSPDIDTRKPVSRQHEAEHARYYGYPYYWGGAGLWGMGAYPGNLTAEDVINETLRAAAPHRPVTADDCHLRSSNAVMGYRIRASDGDIGNVDDLLVDDQTWAIRYLIVDTHRWWSGRRVLVAPRWIDDVSWSMATVSVDLTRDAIKGARPYDSEAQLDRQREQALHDHYHRPGYWAAPTSSRRPALGLLHGAAHTGRRR
jgi:sporulation protein YlmC with PRC-barrel domain